MAEKDDTVIKTVDFAEMLMTRHLSENKEAQKTKGQIMEQNSAMVCRARKEGWLEEQDLLEADGELSRRCAAAILHRFLQRVLKEQDVADISAAYELRDLYDCRVCVNHIAQVYVKGIMEAVIWPGPDREHGDIVIFDSGARVTMHEAEKYVERAYDVQKRRIGIR